MLGRSLRVLSTQRTSPGSAVAFGTAVKNRCKWFQRSRVLRAHRHRSDAGGSHRPAPKRQNAPVSERGRSRRCRNEGAESTVTWVRLRMSGELQNIPKTFASFFPI